MIFIYLLISTAGFRDAVMDLIKQNIKKTYGEASTKGCCATLASLLPHFFHRAFSALPKTCYIFPSKRWSC